MASKYERITDLYLQTAGEVATQEGWPRFLTTACYNFRLSFDKQILLYAQRPDATAVLPIEGRQGWNQRFGRWVNRGSKGIAILDSDSNGQARIKYYFDIADTHEGRHPSPVPIWAVHSEQEQAIVETLENSFGVLENTDTLGNALISAASNVMEDNFQDYLAQLVYYKEGSFLEPLDEESLEAIFKPLLQNSIGYMLLVRCGIDPSKHFTPEDFSYISGFNTLPTINALGTATSDISQMCLSEIARTVLSLQRQQNRTFEDAAQKEYAVPENQPERSMNHDTDHIHEAGGLSASQPSPAPGTPDSPWEVRIDAPQIPAAEPESDLHESSDHGTAPQSPDGDRADSPEPGGENRHTDGEGGGGNGGAESHRPDEVGGADEQFPLSSGGADSAGIDLRIEGILPPPSFEEQISFLDGGYLAPEQEGEKQTFFSQPQLPQQVIDEALCIGFNDQNSRLIICAYFMKDKPLEDNAAFLQKCYGTNGAGLFIQDREYAIWYDAAGIRIATGRTVQKRYAALVTWEQAAKRIRELLDLGRYMPQSELDRVQDFERLELAKSLIYARREFSDEARDAGYLPLTTLTYSAKGGFPEIEVQMQHLLEDRDTLSQLVDEWTLFANVYEKDRSLLRSRLYDPVALLRRLEDLQRESLVFTAADGYDPQRHFFISDDEIDRVLRGSERSYESRLDTFSFFSRNTDFKERERFLKQQHGEYSGYHGGNDNQTYTSAGLSFSHGSLTEPYAHVELKWPAITKRVSDMISMGRFLYPSDAERMADYEVKKLAKLVMNFFRDAPVESARPTQKSIFDYWDGVADIQGQLTDPERVREIYETMMLPLWNATLPGDRFYQERGRGTEAMQAYQAGTFSVFGRDHTLRPLPKLTEAVPIQENKPTERAFLDKAKYLIDSYCQEVFGQDADCSDLSHVDLAYGSTSDSQHTVEIFADLSAFRLVYQVDKETVHEISCDSLQKLNEYLANLDFDTMIAHAEERYQTGLEDTFDDIDPEQIWQNLAQRGIVNGELVDPEALENAPFIQQVVADAEAAQEPTAPIPPQPKPKRERITFEPLYPEIPKEQRINFRITDLELGYGTASEKYAANTAAIRLLKRIEDEGRLATPAEQEILSRYVGWGGLADCLDEKHSKFQELKALLSEEEYAAARASSLTAFYTSPVIIQAMYQALEQMGFREGNILEPSCGVGNFIGMIPESMAGSHAYGVELDSISGRIAQQLYQNSSIAVTGFEKVQMPDSFFDVAMGNVPFGDFKVLDKRYDKHHWLIHDYFFGKTLDKVRPGGIVSFITSKGTMDKENSDVRKYLAQRADLIGAIRLPNTAFKRNAGTEVTSDILFLQKRDRMTDIEPDWVHLDTDPNGIRMNSYFVQNPDMILGKMVMESTRFGMDSVCRGDENADLSELLQSAIQNLHAEITEYQHEELEKEDNSIPADPNVRNFSFCLVDGKVYFRENSRMNPVEVSVTAENRIRGMIALRDCVRRLIDYQTEGYPDEDIQREQRNLNTLYDEYTKEYGLLSSRGNSLAFGEDSSYFLLCSLEVLDEEGNFKRKADMFTKRTIRPHVAVTSVDTASEALAVSIAEKARVDMPFMAELSGKTEAELEAELAGVIFRDVNCAERKEEIPVAFVDLERYNFVTADEYLSGNVRRKLRMVKALQEVLPPEKKELLARNIEALTAVQPVDLTAGEIGVRIGVNWMPKEIYEQFLYEVIGTSAYARDKIHVLYSPHSGEWNVTNKSFDGSNIKAVTTYGTKRINAYHIFEQTLNQKDARIYDTKIDANGNEVRVLNKKETAIAQDRQELIKAKFAEWVWKDIDRRERLCGIYNETFNAIRPREYDGQHIRFSGMNPEITLRKHQINAIAHIMYGGNTLLAHEVGAGKTFEIVAAAMESKRLGLCTKSLIVVPNHITEQWAAEWLQLYPSANILVATKKDFETKNRKKFCARIATGDYDAIIIGHSQFEKIPMSKERQEIILRRQIDSILDGIREAKRNHAENYSIKQMERTRKSLETRLAKLNDQGRKDDVVTFEQLGVDRIFVDESHFFKNLFLATKMRNVGGIAQTEAQKSSDLFMKCQYLDEITGNRGVIFATGTPISNSMVELYTIQRYLQYSTLEEMGLLNFDDWAANYGETVTAIELSPEGSGYRSKTRFAKFYNLPELMATFKMVADIQTADMLMLPVPKANFHTEVIKPSPMQEDMIKSLADRAEEIRAGNVAPSVDNMLKITNDGRKLALDMRLVNPLAPDSDTSKTSICAQNVFSIWERTQEQRSAQLVFCDLSTPKGDGSFNVYDDLKAKLVAKGIPPEEIAYIHEANTEVRKKELFSKVRSGQVRVLIGSTAKMGAGTNCQDKLIALHDADCPWRPSDLAQRLGRIVRQGNQNPEVEIFRYVTENTFDAYLYQLVENKQKFIAQIMTSKAPARIADDVDETALSYSEIKALATGNPLIIEKCNLDVEVSKLNMLKANHLNQRFALENMVLRKYPADIAKLTEAIAGYEKDVATAQAHPKPAEGFVGMEVMGTHYSEKEAAGKAVIRACTELQSADPIPLGQYRGFSMSLQYDAAHTDYKLTMKGAMSHTISLGADVFGNITRMDNLVDGLSKGLAEYQAALQDTRTQLANAKAEMETPFAKETELAEKSARLKELNILLNMDQKDKTLLDDALEQDSTDREQPRSMER
jgi:N12 class adenine-specific DNA methylase